MIFSFCVQAALNVYSQWRGDQSRYFNDGIWHWFCFIQCLVCYFYVCSIFTDDCLLQFTCFYTLQLLLPQSIMSHSFTLSMVEMSQALQPKNVRSLPAVCTQSQKLSKLAALCWLFHQLTDHLIHKNQSIFDTYPNDFNSSSYLQYAGILMLRALPSNTIGEISNPIQSKDLQVSAFCFTFCALWWYLELVHWLRDDNPLKYIVNLWAQLNSFLYFVHYLDLYVSMTFWKHTFYTVSNTKTMSGLFGRDFLKFVIISQRATADINWDTCYWYASVCCIQRGIKRYDFSSYFMRNRISKSTAKLNIKWLCLLHFLHLCMEQSLLWSSLHFMVNINQLLIDHCNARTLCVCAFIQMHYRLCFVN